MKTIAMLCFGLLASATAFAAPPTAAGRYCDNPAAGSANAGYSLIVDVGTHDGSSTVMFEVNTDSTKPILGDGPLPVAVDREGVMRFSFTDSWNNFGRGRFAPSREFELILDETAEGGTRVADYYRTFHPTLGACTAADQKRKLVH